MTSLKHYLQHADTLLRLHLHTGRQPRDIRRFQERKLRFLVRHAFEHVPLYRRKLEAAGVRPRDIRGLEDLPLLPVTTKPEMRAASFTDQTAEGASIEDLWLRYTAGSTGEPAHIYRRPIEDHLLNQFFVRASRMLGQRLGDSAATLSAFSDPNEEKKGWLTRTARSLIPGKDMRIDGMQPPGLVVSQLQELQPDIIRSFPGVLADVASHWPRAKAGTASPRWLVTSGEPLTPNLRRSIEEGFGKPVYDAYRSHEFNLLAWECRETGLMHVCDDNVIVEVLHDGEPAAENEEGDVVVTALHSYTAPYVRYALGDIAVRGPSRCPCGAPFSTLKSIHGRTMDTCVTPDGRTLHHWHLIPFVFWSMDWYQRYQLVQKSPTHVVLRVILTRDPPAEDLEKLESGILEKLGPQGRCDIEPADEMLIAKSGKHHVCISELKRD